MLQYSSKKTGFLLFCLLFTTQAFAQQDTLFKYHIDQTVPFNPIAGTGTAVFLSDDVVSGALPIGFTFEFFGQPYSQFYISSNGFVTFNSDQPNGCCSGAFLPTADVPNNLIALAWEDLNPGAGGSIHYFTTGNAPNRRLVVNYSNVPHYPANLPVTMQLILFEGSNGIEIHTTNMPTDGGVHTQGIENETGEIAYFLDGRNAASWSVTNDAVRFSPLLASDDAGIEFIPSTTTFQCTGVNPVEAVIRNFGVNRIDSVDVYWEFNGVLQMPVRWITPLGPYLSGDSSRARIVLGTRSFTAGETYALKVWTAYPNGVTDSLTYNDTLSVSGRVALGGSFTIGGSSPDYSTFTQAINDLVANGICAPVIFNVRNGVYNEQLSIPAILNAAGANTITFQSESGSNTDVSLTFSANASNNYTLRLNGSDNVIFKNLTISSANATYGRVIDIRGGSNDNKFLNCVLAGVPVTSSADQWAVIYSPSTSNVSEYDNRNIFRDNLIRNGSAGIFFTTQGNGEQDLIIENNQFENQAYYGIYLQVLQSIQILSNRIVTGNNQSGYIGIYASNIRNNYLISKNRITITSGRGVYMLSSSQGITSNNFISIGGNSTAFGIQSIQCSEVLVAHNNIHISSSHITEGRCIEITSSSQIRLQNNILSNTGPGYSAFISGSSVESDHNSFYHKGTRIGYFDGDRLTLADWQSASFQDEHSILTDPLFSSSSDLHVNKALLNGTGLSVAEVTDDIDGDSRLSPPDIGADEFQPVGENAELLFFDKPALPFAAGTYPIKAVLRNSGASALTSVDISWELNGALQPVYHWSGSLPTGGIDTVMLSNFEFNLPSAYRFKVWTSNPNNTTDIELQNDTIRVPAFYIALQGEYTIGGSSPDFTTFTQATAALNNGGVLGAVTFNVRNGTYTEQVLIRSFPGNSCTNPVVFQSESGDSTAVVLQYSANSTSNYTLLIDGADGIVMNKLTLKSLQGTYGRVIDLQNGASCNQFTNCILQGISTNSTGDNLAIIYSRNNASASLNEINNEFRQNLFSAGSFGLYYNGYGYGSDNSEPGTVIENNRFENQRYMGMYLINQFEPVVTGNTIVTNSTYTSYFGIYFQYVFGGSRIEKNKITVLNSGYGMYFYDSHGFGGDRLLVANNFVIVRGNSAGYGIQFQYGSQHNIYHNNVLVAAASGYAFYANSVSELSIVNNVFSNTHATGYAIGLQFNSGLYADYNDLYSLGNVGYWNNQNQTGLLQWQLASGQDTHSLSSDPLFLSATDLHVNKALLNDVATPLSEITEDIDSELRAASPDIGADEFQPTGENAELVFIDAPQPPVAAGSYPIRAGLRNSGASPLTSVDISWEVNGTQQPVYHWTGSLATGQLDTVLLSDFEFNGSSAYNLKAWTSNPNATTDIELKNDTIQLQNFYLGLQGTYTIGGTSPDFANFNAAINALNYGGILGPVTFNVRNGIYAEQLLINSFPGNSCSTPVIFQAESGDSTAVILQFSANSQSNYTIRIQDADGIEMRNMTIKSLHSTYGRVLHLQREASCNQITGCIIQAPITTSTGDHIAIVYAAPEENVSASKNTFTYNSFTGGSYGILYMGYNNGNLEYEPGITVENNRFENQRYSAIRLDNQRASLIRKNTITTNSTLSEFYGIWLNSVHGAPQVEKNRISVLNGGYGIYGWDLQGTEANYVLVANNFVSIGGTNWAYGIYMQGSRQKIYHNNVNVSSTHTGSVAFYSYSSSQMRIANNIFAHTGEGYAIFLESFFGEFYSDHNDLFTQGINLGYLNGNNNADLLQWQANTGLDANSVSADPQFLSATDLHVQAVVLDKSAEVVPEVADDIDDQLRNPLTPDIGADEFTTASEDASLVSVLSPSGVFTAGSHDVRVVLLNNASEELTQVTINWSVNDSIQSPYLWSGTLASGDTTHVSIGAYSFEAGGGYSIEAWSSLPNNLPDEEPGNDTTRAENLFVALAGLYTIGGTTPDFVTIEQAVTAMVNGTVIDSVVFLIRAGTYIEQLTIPQVPGSSAEHHISFVSESGNSGDVKITFAPTSAKNYVVQLDGADYITFREITVEATGSSYGTVLDIRNSSSNNRFIHNVLKGVTTTSSSEYLSVIFSTSAGVDHNNIFSENQIAGGSYGIRYIGAGTSVSQRDTGTIIAANTFSGQSYTAIQLYYQDSPVIKGNVIISGGASLDFYGIYLQNCYNATEIKENKLNIHRGFGIFLYSCPAIASQPAVTANNFIYVAGTGNAYGLAVYYSDYHRLYYNSVNIGSTHLTAGRALHLESVTQSRMLNNIFANLRGGIAISVNNISSYESDYNDLYTTGTVLGLTPSGQANLAAWQTATGQEAHSLSVAPAFESAIDLHVREAALNNAGTPVGEIVSDIDNEIRDLQFPDIGADEFIPPVEHDAGVTAIVSPVMPFAIGDQPVQVMIRNHGSLPLTQATVQWAVNGAQQPDVSWTGVIGSGREDTVMLGVRAFEHSRRYDIKAWTINPNGFADTVNYNDTTHILNLYTAFSGTYTIGGTDPDFENIIDAVAALKNGGVAGPVTFDIRNGTYNGRISIPQIPGSAADKRILFRSASGDSTKVIITNNSAIYNDYTVQLAGADFITFEHLTFSTEGTSYNNVIDIRNESSYNIFSGNVIRSAASSLYTLVLSASNSLNEYTTFQNNHFINGFYGINYSGYNSANFARGILIQGNVFENQGYLALSGTYLDAPRILSNTILTSSTRTDFSGIYLNANTNDFRIQKNRIYAPNGGYGISIVNSHTIFSVRGKIVNNFVSVGGPVTSYGIYVASSSNHDVYFNSVNVTGSHTTAGRSFYAYYTENLVLLNNIFANSGGGYSIYSDGTNSITSSNYNNLFTSGLVLGYWSGNRATLDDWKTASAKDAQSLSTDPSFYSDEDLHVSHILLDSVGIPVAEITDDIDGDMRNISRPDIGADEFTYYPNDIGITQLLSPVTGCGLDSALQVRVRITNFGGESKTAFDVAYTVNGGTPVVENVGDLILPPGSKANFTFTTRADLSDGGAYTINAYTLLFEDQRKENDSLTTVITSYPALTASSWNMLPADSTSTVSQPVAFSWVPVENALRYDLYIWLAAQPTPTAPTVANIQAINYTYTGSLTYGAAYKWKLVAKNQCSELASPEQVFILRNLPDLIVSDIQIPVTVFSGQEVQVTWEITNAANGGTQSTRWIDAVYLSSDAVFEISIDRYLGGVNNFSALEPGQRYNNTSVFTIPEGISGEYYIFVRTDIYGALLETNENNNIERETLPLQVILTPPPDLRVTSIISPEIAFSGQDIEITWTVENAGSGRTDQTEWYDKIYFTSSEQFVGGPDVGRVRHTGELLPDSSYTASRTIRVPEGIFGKYYVYIQTDHTNTVYEHAFESNNVTRSDSVHVILTPPADYVVTQVVVSPTVSNLQKVNVLWTVENQGGSIPATSGVEDAIYISSSPDNFSLANAVLLGTLSRYGALEPGAGYSASREVTIPASITGEHYIYVKTDSRSQVFEYTNEQNNVSRSNVIAIRQPDLRISSAAIEGSAGSGVPVLLKYMTRNDGEGNLYKTRWKDKIYLSSSAILQTGDAILLDSIVHDDALNAGDTLPTQRAVRIPDGVSGLYYMHVWADQGNAVYEGTHENNNTGSTAIFAIALSPWADLQVSSITVPDSLQAGFPLQTEFIVVNNGDAGTQVSAWKDRVYISPDSVFNGNAILLGDISRTSALAIDSTYTASLAALTLPAKLRRGDYYIYVQADGDGNVYEHTDESNNRLRSAKLYIKSYPPVDLQVSLASYTGEAASGKSLSVNWTVNNSGLAITPATRWTDVVVLSKNALFDIDDNILTGLDHSGALRPGESYNATKAITLPNGISGTYYLLVITDEDVINVDVDPDNNMYVIGPINVELTKSSDLIVSSFTAPPSGIAGQPLEVSWTVRNAGEGATLKGSWTDKIYLSSNNVLDNTDLTIGSLVRTGNLVAGDAYTAALQVIVPSNFSGNYVLIVKTDNNDVEYEHNGEQNNTKGSIITITRPPASDLVVLDVTLPGEAFTGETVSLRWTLSNNSVNPASGVMKEALYLSADTLWDIEDVLIGTYDVNANIVPNGVLQREVAATLPGVRLGNYYLICKTDILNNIYEISDDNNVTTSRDYITISVPQLMLDEIATATLLNEKNLYYRLEVPPSLQGESLLFTLQGDSLNGSNEFYIRYGEMPDRVEYDFSHENPFQGNQEIVIPEAIAGTYYLMVYGSTRTGTSQLVELFAKVLNFEIRSVNARKGGNTGRVTIQINGSKFTESMDLMLRRGAVSLQADTLLFVNSTKIFATFDLDGAELGLYDLLAVNEESDTAALMQCFEVEDGQVLQLLTNVVAPSSTRPGTIVSVRIEFANAGNVNIENPVVTLISAGGAPVAFTVEELIQRRMELVVPLNEFRGPVGVLRPGATGSVIIYGKADSNLSFILVLPEAHKAQ